MDVLGSRPNSCLIMSLLSTSKTLVLCELIGFYHSEPILPSKIMRISNLSAEEIVRLVTLCTGVLNIAESEPITVNLRIFRQVVGSIFCPAMT